MADLTISNVPTSAIPYLVAEVALRTGVEIPATNAEKQAMVENYARRELAALVRRNKARVAEVTIQNDTSDPDMNWGV